ncbi:uncharacterized protein LOC109598214 isoform X2 [Aethina tumida]|uniref:uncharacterized protein LOC109598214 isoform X2 n=1 Tax=Aethina tumida TaxID=116153 RepID=UPI00214987E8|nr:uncharacterized protein LOC109598214 isoform X2 [Aethina tumida]
MLLLDELASSFSSIIKHDTKPTEYKSAKTVPKTTPEVLKTTETCSDVEFSPHKTLKRKFPGPAGLLPERKTSKHSPELEQPSTESQTISENIICSQQTATTFEDKPWTLMCKDIQDNLLETFNINWIQTQVNLNKLYNKKAPFLAAIIQTLDVPDTKIPTVNVTLKDRSGSIQGTILSTLYEEYAEFLLVGAVLVLKNFGVLTTGKNTNIHLTITPNNLLTIYSNLTNDCYEQYVKKTVVQMFKSEDIWKSYIKPKISTEIKKTNFNSLYNKSNSVVKLVNNKPKQNVFDTSVGELDLTLEDDFNIPDDFEEKVLSQISIKTDKNSVKTNEIVICDNNKDKQILENIFDGVNTEDLFDDF